MEPHPKTIAAREDKTIKAEAIGIDPSFISNMVERFYARVREDTLLGPIFQTRIDDWPTHLHKMKAFWSSILYKSGGFSGNPMMKHVAIPGIEEAEFEHWLKLFRATLEEIEINDAATKTIHARADMIADSLLTGIRIHRDGKLPNKQRKG
ncbi:group III truncated hemoglobin [Sphingorhabdus arenilitoris]|uniref:Group III truncated hemoglobin n=1 Tax=Sphingorhabdus arenilitoris TaxID=1490041 RepID=A0ABV8RGL7_9SPHN